MEEEHVEDGRAGVIYQEFDVGRSLAASSSAASRSPSRHSRSRRGATGDGGVPLPQQSGSLCIIAR